jgi:hypothetical protein
VSALPELQPGSAGCISLLTVERYLLNSRPMEQEVEFPKANLALSRADHHCRLKDGDGRHQSNRIRLNEPREFGGLGFGRQDGDKRGRINHHAPNSL